MKKIGVSTRIVKAENFDETRDAISHDLSKMLEKIGCIPILIPNNLENVSSFLESLHLQGLILSGGDNIGDNILRDDTEKKIIEFAIQSKIPLLGICRGMQVINKYFGGEIMENKDSKHVTKSHFVNISSPITELLKTTTIQTNSYHNNTIPQNMLGKKLKLFAVSSGDETVEGFCHEELPLSGVMWHPERDQNQNNLLIVKHFLKSNNKEK